MALFLTCVAAMSRRLILVAARMIYFVAVPAGIEALHTHYVRAFCRVFRMLCSYCRTVLILIYFRILLVIHSPHSTTYGIPRYRLALLFGSSGSCGRLVDQIYIIAVPALTCPCVHRCYPPVLKRALYICALYIK